MFRCAVIQGLSRNLRSLEKIGGIPKYHVQILDQTRAQEFLWKSSTLECFPPGTGSSIRRAALTNSHQFIVDSLFQIKMTRLNFNRRSQRQLRRDTVQDFKDYILNVTDCNEPPGS